MKGKESERKQKVVRKTEIRPHIRKLSSGTRTHVRGYVRTVSQ